MDNGYAGERIYRYRSGAAVKQQILAIIICMPFLLLSGALVVDTFTHDRISSIFLAILFAIPGLVILRVAVTAHKKFGSDGLLALGVSSAGLRFPSQGFIEWRHIDLVLLDARSGSINNPLGSWLSSLVLLGVDHVRVGTLPGPSDRPRVAAGGYATHLEGGRGAYVQLCQDIIAMSAAHPHVRVRLAIRTHVGLPQLLGNPAMYSLQEEQALRKQRSASS